MKKDTIEELFIKLKDTIDFEEPNDGHHLRFLKDLNSEKSPETERIINDTMLQLKKLELNYTEMEQDLINGGNGKLILSAMITNFQTRIELLNEVMTQIENIKTIKNTNDANYTI